MTRVVQISDTHLSPRKTHFVENWEPLRAWIVAQRPDLVIHTGDVTLDGAGDDEDMRYCAELMRALPAPVLADIRTSPSMPSAWSAGGAISPTIGGRGTWRAGG